LLNDLKQGACRRFIFLYSTSHFSIT